VSFLPPCVIPAQAGTQPSCVPPSCAIPAQAGTQVYSRTSVNPGNIISTFWIPTFVGMTRRLSRE